MISKELKEFFNTKTELENLENVFYNTKKVRKSTMISKELKEFFNTKTELENLGNEELIIKNAVYGKAIGEAINKNKMLEFSSELSRNLLDMDIYKGAVVANFIGFACEKTENTSAGKGVIDLLVKFCKLVEEFVGYFTDEEGEVELPQDLDPEEIFQSNSQCVSAYYGFDTLCIAAMAFLARDNQWREYLRTFELGETLAFLAQEVPITPYTRSVQYINRIYDTCSKLPLLVLDTRNKQGFIAEANDVDNCFHLIFLLEEAIYQNYTKEYGMETYECDSDLKALAHGEYPSVDEKSYTTYFTECNYGEYIWRKQKENEDNPNGWLNYLIWGEMPPAHIPKLEDYHVILLKNGGPSRSFSPGFLCVGHEALHPYVNIQRSLSAWEYSQWEAKLDAL